MNLPLERVRLRNFKAVQDSGPIQFTPLTVFVGNNGSGKSSVLEGLETLHLLASENLDDVFHGRWNSFEDVWNKAAPHPLYPANEMNLRLAENPMAIQVEGVGGDKPHGFETSITRDAEGRIRFAEETYLQGQSLKAHRNSLGQVEQPGEVGERSAVTKAPDGVSLLALGFDFGLHRWQFLTLEASRLGAPSPRKQTTGARKLRADGSNLADYLQDILFKDDGAFNRLVSSLTEILPYARDFQVTAYSEVDQKVYLEMAEGDFRIPGWMLSSGSLRLTAILACLYHPEPPPVLVIEEIENGLDPKTLGFLVSQLQTAVENGTQQVIVTTHSEYLLNLFSLRQIILVQRENGGQPRFWRPSDSEKLREWARQFAPGTLYTKGDFHREMPGP